MNPLPVEPAHRLAARPEERRWLVEGLWADEAVGIVGGEPKCCKSFLALDLAVSVAAGSPCLRRFAVPRPGRVLLFAAEDALHVVRRRLEGICEAIGIALESLDVQVITAPAVRLDLEADRRRLEDTVASLKPRLLVLDPFVRLHRIDENVSGEVAPLLAYLRELQRRHALAVVVVHHARKGAAAMRAGQALRGSSEFHAWGDSNLYLRRRDDALLLSIEHRAAPATASLPLALRDHPGLALSVAEDAAPTVVASAERCASVEDRLLETLANSDAALPVAALRRVVKARTRTVTDALAKLVREERVERTPAGYRARR